MRHQLDNKVEVRGAYFGAVLAAHEVASVATQKAEAFAQNLVFRHARRRGKRRAVGVWSEKQKEKDQDRFREDKAN